MLQYSFAYKLKVLLRSQNLMKAYSFKLTSLLNIIPRDTHHRQLQEYQPNNWQRGWNQK